MYVPGTYGDSTPDTPMEKLASLASLGLLHLRVVHAPAPVALRTEGTSGVVQLVGKTGAGVGAVHRVSLVDPGGEVPLSGHGVHVLADVARMADE